MNGPDQPDVLVIGGGMVGATAACLFARLGMTVCVLESRPPEPFDPGDDVGLRVSAVSPGSARVLEAAGAWAAIERGRHCPYRRMRVEDGSPAVAVEFNSGEFGLERLGTLVENDFVQDSLWRVLGGLAGVERVTPATPARLDLLNEDPSVVLESGRTLRPRLVVGADGGASAVAAALGVERSHTAYGQRGVVAVVETERPNPGLAWQRFLPGGPLALLPLADGRSSIVWTRPESEAARLQAAGDEVFVEDLNRVFASGEGPFGAVTGTGPRAGFPLHLQLAGQYAAYRCVLIGDAAHVVHPLAGQGVNIGLLDAAALVEAVAGPHRETGDPGDARALARYARQRRSEAEVLARGIHALHGLFGTASLGPLRRLGLRLVSSSWSLREPFIRRAAGLHAGAPALARGTPLRALAAG